MPSGSASRCCPMAQLRANSFVERGAFRAGMDRGGRQARIVAGNALDVGLECLDALDLEADVIHAGGDDAGAVIVGDVPRHDHQRHVAVSQVVVRIVGALLDVRRREVEHIAVEFRHVVGVHRTERHVIDVARIGLAVVLDIDRRAVRHILLRDVEHIAVGIVRADAGERPRGRTLEPFHGRVFLAHALEAGFGVLDLDAEMVEPGGTSGAARIDVQADIAVAHRDRPARPRLVRGLHAERRDIELRELGVVLADDGDVIDLREHSFLPARAAGFVPVVE